MKKFCNADVTHITYMPYLITLSEVLSIAFIPESVDVPEDETFVAITYIDLRSTAFCTSAKALMFGIVGASSALT